MDTYINWLRNERFFAEGTIHIYFKYIDTFLKSKLSLKEFIKKYTYYCNNTKRIMLSALKSYLLFKKDKRYKLITLPKKEIKVCDYISEHEYRSILVSIKKNTYKQWEKYVLIRMLFETGIRSNELLGIKQSDISKNRIIINGKGKKQRYVYVTDSLEEDLQIHVSNTKDEYIFPFSYKALYKRIGLLEKYIGKKITPHMFRRGFATYCNLKGLDIYAISVILGHSSLNTTKTYIYNESIASKMAELF